MAVHVEGDPTVYAGTVARVSPAFEEANRSLIVKAEIPNPAGRLRPGAFARAEIGTESAPILSVPASNLATGMDVVAENSPSAPSGPGARATAAP